MVADSNFTRSAYGTSIMLFTVTFNNMHEYADCLGEGPVPDEAL